MTLANETKEKQVILCSGHQNKLLKVSRFCIILLIRELKSAHSFSIQNGLFQQKRRSKLPFPLIEWNFLSNINTGSMDASLKQLESNGTTKEPKVSSAI